jgi:hypothetical protein
MGFDIMAGTVPAMRGQTRIAISTGLLPGLLAKADAAGPPRHAGEPPPLRHEQVAQGAARLVQAVGIVEAERQLAIERRDAGAARLRSSVSRVEVSAIAGAKASAKPYPTDSSYGHEVSGSPSPGVRNASRRNAVDCTPGGLSRQSGRTPPSAFPKTFESRTCSVQRRVSLSTTASSWS